MSHKELYICHAKSKKRSICFESERCCHSLDIGLRCTRSNAKACRQARNLRKAGSSLCRASSRFWQRGGAAADNCNNDSPPFRSRQRPEKLRKAKRADTQLHHHASSQGFPASKTSTVARHVREKEKGPARIYFRSTC